jgi:hypothetical protein
VAVALDDDTIPTFFVTNKGIADALAKGIVNRGPFIAKNAIRVLGVGWFHTAFCRTMRSHWSLS